MANDIQANQALSPCFQMIFKNLKNTIRLK